MSRDYLTEREVGKLMNSINEDLKFTTESERDYENKRLPTLSFEMWSNMSGISHSYYEKSMRSQVLTTRRSSQPENSKFSILVNELNRRFEVMSTDIKIEEKIEVIEKFCQQLVNSGYDYPQVRNIVLSSLKGTLKKEKRLMKERKRYKSSKETLSDRIEKKLTEAVSWYRAEMRKEEREEGEDEEFKREKGSWEGWRKYKKKKGRVKSLKEKRRKKEEYWEKKRKDCRV